MGFVSFSEDEVIREGERIEIHPPITPRENYIRTLKKENPLWIPTRTDSLNFLPRIYPDNIARAFVIEQNKYEGPVGGSDIFGVKWKYIPVAGGSMVEPGKPFLNDISEWKEKVVFPDIDSWDWEGSAKENKDFLNQDKFRFIWIFSGMFERLISFLDFEDAAVALIDEEQQDDVKELFQALADFYKKLIDKYLEYFEFDAVYFHDDWGSQKAPFFSVDTCMEMIVPYVKQVVDHCHDRGLYFELHCCGKNERLVPCMLACGIDSWCGQPLNDKVMLVEQYGDRFLVGVHSPFDPAHPVPEDQQELERKVVEFLAPFEEHFNEKPIFIADLMPNDRARAAFYEYGRKMMEKFQK